MLQGLDNPWEVMVFAWDFTFSPCLMCPLLYAFAITRKLELKVLQASLC